MFNAIKGSATTSAPLYMRRFERLVVGGLFILGVGATGCAGQISDTEQGEAAAGVAVVNLLVHDLNADGRTDLGVTTKEGTVYSAIGLLNRGDGVFEWKTAKTTEGAGFPKLESDGWIAKGSHSIGVLEKTVGGLSDALSKLDGKRLTMLGLTESAATARAQNSCPEHWLCMWEHPGYNGAMYGSTLNGCRAMESSLGPQDDWASAFWNRSGCTVCVYESVNYLGGSGVLWPNQSDDDLYRGAPAAGWDNLISSWATKGSGAACFL